MVNNLCNIGKLLRSVSHTESAFNPFLEIKNWKKSTKPPFDALKQSVLNLPVVKTKGGQLKIDFAGEYFQYSQNEDYRFWRALKNPNGGKAALWVDGDITDISLIKDKTKSAKAKVVANNYFAKGLFDEVTNNIATIEALLVKHGVALTKADEKAQAGDKEEVVADEESEKKETKFTPNYLIHFVYPGGEHWYEQADSKRGIFDFIHKELIQSKKVGAETYYIPTYNYLGCVNEESRQMPDFNTNNLYKNISFRSTEKTLDFFWAQNFYESTVLRLKGDYELRILPDATNAMLEDLLAFYRENQLSKTFRKSNPAILLQAEAAENKLHPVAVDDMFGLFDDDEVEATKVGDINFTATIFLATSGFSIQEITTISSLTNSAFSKQLRKWNGVIEQLAADSYWSAENSTPQYVVWGDYKRKDRAVPNSVETVGAIQTLFTKKSHIALYPKFFYQLFTTGFAYDDLNRVLLANIYEQCLKKGLKAGAKWSSAVRASHRLKNSFLILTSLQMKALQTPTSYLTTPSFLLGVAIGRLLGDIRYFPQYSNLHNRVYEIGGNIKRHVSDIKDVGALVSEIGARLLRNHANTDGKRLDNNFTRAAIQAVFQAMASVDTLVPDETAIGFYWEFFKSYEGKSGTPTPNATDTEDESTQA